MSTHHLYDVVLYGATGFVGRQTVAYFAAHPDVAASGLRWALAGRNLVKLKSIQSSCPGAAGAGIVVAAADDVPALEALAKSARVVLSTAGPFALYGSALVAACVKHGTHYVDITGETPWVSGLIARHHDQAAQDGTRIVPFCGFDSVPSDIGSWLMTRAMLARHQTPCVDVKAAFSMRGGFNGGTLASVLNIMGSPDAQLVKDPFLLNPKGQHPQPTGHRDPLLPGYDADFKAWLGPFFMGLINTRVVRRSAALLAYHSDFHYQEYLRVGSGPVAGVAATSLGVGTAFGMTVGAAALGFSPVRRLAATLMPKPGEGPSEASMNTGSFACELVGKSAAGQVLRGRIQDQGDPGNRATTKMVCEAALCLALNADQLPGCSSYGGVLTPASALGDVLVDRLRSAGMTLAVDPA